MHYCLCENGEYKKYTKKQRAKYNDNLPKYCFQNYKWGQSLVKNYFYLSDNSVTSQIILFSLLALSLKYQHLWNRGIGLFFRFILLWPYFGSAAVFPLMSSEPTESLAFSEWEMSSIVWGDWERVLEDVVESESNAKTGLTLALSPMHCSISFWNFQVLCALPFTCYLRFLFVLIPVLPLS